MVAQSVGGASERARKQARRARSGRKATRKVECKAAEALMKESCGGRWH